MSGVGGSASLGSHEMRNTASLLLLGPPGLKALAATQGDTSRSKLQSVSSPPFLEQCNRLHRGLTEARVAVGRQLAQDAPAGYEACYPHLVHLHMLRDLELASAAVLEPSRQGRLSVLGKVLPAERMRMLR